MAEFLLKVGSGRPPSNKKFEDGDVVASFNNRQIRQVHSEHICHVNQFGFKDDGLRPDSLAKTNLEITRKYRFERISQTQVNRINIVTLESETISDVPNARGEYIDVGLFIRRKLLHPKHLIFGTPGSEVWYGGFTDYSNAKLDLVWQAIEAQTSNREIDFTLFLLGIQDKKSFLALRVDDFTDSESIQYTTPVEDITGTTPDGDPIFEVVQKRKWLVNWRRIVPPGSIPDIVDRNKSVDGRNDVAFSRAAVLEEKSPRGPSDG